MGHPTFQNTSENDEDLSEATKEIDLLTSDKDSIGNRRDESQIISDQDMTNEHDIAALDENMGAKTRSLDSLEEEPLDFIQGEVDVVTQIERTTQAMEEAALESSGRKAHTKPDTYKHE